MIHEVVHLGRRNGRDLTDAEVAYAKQFLTGRGYRGACENLSPAAWSCSIPSDHKGPHVALLGYESVEKDVCSLWGERQRWQEAGLAPEGVVLVPKFTSVTEADAWLESQAEPLYSCDCCDRVGLTDDEIAEHTGDRDTPNGFMAVPTECIYCREARV